MRFGEYMQFLRRSLGIIVVSILAGVSFAGLWTLTRTPEFRASTQLFVSPRMGADSLGDINESTITVSKLIDTYVGIVGTDIVLVPLSEALGSQWQPNQLRNMVSAKSSSGTVLIDITARDPDAQSAALIANTAAGIFTSVIGDQLEGVGAGQSARILIELVQPASVPERPETPDTARNLTVGFFMGAIVGLAIGAIRQVADSKLRNRDDVEEVADVPVLGTIGYDPTASLNPLIVLDAPASPRSEAYRSLRTNLQFLRVEGNPRSFVVTSPGPGEGKTTTAANLAITIAQAGSTVCVVDADLRKPRLAPLFGIEGGVGLTDVLIGQAELDSVLQEWGDPNLTLLPSGHRPPNPSELLGSSEMASLLADLGSRFDYVLVDAPPLLVVTDAAVASQHVSGALMVVAAGETRRDGLEDAIQAMDTANSRVLGVILTKAPTKGPYSYKYSSYAYSDQGTSEPSFPATQAQ